MKKFDANLGVLLDHNFIEHARDCPQCRQFDAERPVTASVMCLEGSVLWKRDNATRPARPDAPRDGNRGTKDEVKRLTRYKGE